MKKLFLAACLFLATFSITAQTSPVTLTSTTINSGDDGNPPKAKVYVAYAGKKVFVENTSAPSVTGGTEKPGLEKNMLDKGQAWWAGAGNDYFVYYKGGKILVYRRFIQEEGGNFPKKLVKTITLNQLTKKPAELKKAIESFLKG